MKTNDFIKDFSSVEETQILSPEAMNELDGGCSQSCKTSCSPGCSGTAINGTTTGELG